MSVANNLIGKTLNKRYEILRPLGRGGMGKVYLAKDTRFGKQVVVKVPTMEVEDNDFKARFMREIASLAALEHPHIVTTVDWGEIEGIPFLVLRYLGGGNLRDRITDSQGLKKLMPLEGLNQWLPQIASALDFIHAKNWVHRDLKPDNILFDEVGNPYLADFGIAKALEGAPMGVKTTMGCFIGTPQYMAPEMHLGKGIGPKADQFGLAVLVYESLAGEIPFTGATPTAIFLDVMRGKPKLIHELASEIPLQKSNALMKGLAKDQNRRHDNCGLFASEITGIKLGIEQLFQGTGEFLISGQIEPLQMKPPIKTGFSVIPDEVPSMTELAATKVVRDGVIPLGSQMPAKVEEAIVLPELQSTREIRKNAKSLPPQMPVKVEEAIVLPELHSTREIRKNTKTLPFQMPAKIKKDKIYIQNREKNKIFLRVVLWVGGILILATVLYLVVRISGKKAEANFLEVPFTEIKAKEAQKAVAKDLQKEVEEKADLGKGVSLDMVLIPAGQFKMGSPQSKTQYKVKLPKPFYMGKYEVTQKQWERLMGKNPSTFKDAKLPVTDVSWEDCQEFIKKLNVNTNGGYRLPTEAEWEYACRAGTLTAYSFGNKITDYANYDGTKILKPEEVGTYKRNAFGLYDMHGNVWEWCEDWLADFPTGPVTVTDPKGPETGTSRVLRGGSFLSDQLRCQSFYRDRGAPDYRHRSNGFRLVMDP